VDEAEEGEGFELQGNLSSYLTGLLTHLENNPDDFPEKRLGEKYFKAGGWGVSLFFFFFFLVYFILFILF